MNRPRNRWSITTLPTPITVRHSSDANARVVCLDRLVFDKDGNILAVKQTFEGVKAHPLRGPRR